MKRLTMLSLATGLSLINLVVIGQGTQSASFRKIGFTNVDLIMGRLPESRAMQNQLEITKAQLEKAIEESITEFQGKADNYQKTAGQMTDIIRADKEKELENLHARIQEMRSKAQISMQNKQQQLMDPIHKKIDVAIQQVGKEHAFVYIFNMDGGQGTIPFILFSSAEENNVTNLILEKLGVDPNKPEPPVKSEKSGTVPAPVNPGGSATKNNKQ